MAHCHTLIGTLRERGYRITPQREMIVEIIAHSGRHMTAEEVFEEVQARTQAVNVATVYRTLELLVEEGLTSQADLGDGRVVFATCHHGPHIHLLCRHCGHVIDADAEPFAPLFQHLQDEYEFVCYPKHFVIYGLCTGCRPADKAVTTQVNTSKEV